MLLKIKCLFILFYWNHDNFELYFQYSIQDLVGLKSKKIYVV